MANRVNRQKKYLKRFKEPTGEERFGIRLILGIAFVLILAAFLHFREVRVQMYEINSSAKAYVVAEVDFEFPDPEATIVLKQEAIRDVGKIYRISEAEIKKVRYKFENYLIHHPNWRKEQKATFEEIYNDLEAVVENLVAARLTDARTLKKREEVKLSTENFYIVSDLEEAKPNELPSSFWLGIENNVTKKYGYDPYTTTFIIDYFKETKWKVVPDIDMQTNFRQVVEDSIPDKLTKVRAGTRIIDQGERVSQRHIAMLKAMKQQLTETRNLWTVQTIFGSLIFSIILTVASSVYFFFRQREFFESIRQLSLYITILTLSLALAKTAEWLILYANTQWIDLAQYPIFVPFIAALVCILLNEELSLYTTLVLTIVMGISLAVDHGPFLFINLITGVFSVLFSTHLKKRKEVFIVTSKIWVIAAIVISAIHLVNKTLFSIAMPVDLAAAAVNLLIIAILLIGFMPILESLFNVMTDMTLMEYMDPTNALLKRLSIEAPGTYQHSLSIGHVAEYVANSIGANGLFCRVTTLYHDIGKLNTPHYYTENQMVSGGKPFNIHQLLTPVESAYIIKSHIPDGIALAKQNKLPQPFIDVIQEHHGTSLIKYFYAKQVEELQGNVEEVDQTAFRYPGPKPQSKETAIIMLADSTEAASRSLEDNAEESIRNMVEKIVNDKVMDGQLDESPLTFQELTLIKQKLVEIIKATHHLRIKYPDVPKNKK